MKAAYWSSGETLVGVTGSRADDNEFEGRDLWHGVLVGEIKLFGVSVFDE